MITTHALTALSQLAMLRCRQTSRRDLPPMHDHCRLLTAVIGSLASLLAGCATSQSGSACRPVDLALNPEPPVLEMFRVYTGADGLSHGEIQHLQASSTKYLGMMLHQYSLGDPSNVVIVSGPPNFHIPKHAAPYREIFLTLRGSVTVELSDGTNRALHPGSLVLYEDVTGPGHGGLVGPCGYTSLDLQFKRVGAP
jgi:hypothetical protein